jgi:RimJ/RimL family protein N-acetyltransferase
MGCNSTETMKISFPLIETARLELRLPTPDDKHSIHSIWSDPDVIRFIPIIMFRTPDEIGEFIRISLERWQERKFGIFTVNLKKTGQVIGYCGLQYLGDTSEVEIYYGFSKESWNQGLATEAATAVLRFGFEELKLESIAAITLPDNIASQNVLKKVGLERSGENRIYHETECVYFTASREQYSPNGECYKLTYV